MKEVKGLLANCQILRTIAWLSSSKDREIDAGDSPPLLNGARPQHPLPSRASAPSFYCSVRSSWCCPLRCSTSSYQRGQADILYLSPQAHFCLFVSVSLFHASQQLLNSETACLNSTEHSLFFLSSQFCVGLCWYVRGHWVLSDLDSEFWFAVLFCSVVEKWTMQAVGIIFFISPRATCGWNPWRFCNCLPEVPGVWPFCTLHRLWCSSLVSFTLFSYPQCPHKGASHDITERGTCGRRSLQ